MTARAILDATREKHVRNGARAAAKEGDEEQRRRAQLAQLILAGGDLAEASKALETLRQAKAPAESLAFLTTEEIAAPLPPKVFPIRGLAMAPGPPTLFLSFSYGGKTIILQDLLLSVATGGKAWGEFRCEPGIAVHVDYEQGRYETIDRYQRLARGRGIDLLAEAGDRLRALVLPPFYLNTPGVADTYKRAAEGAAIVLVDTLAAAAPGEDENDTRIAQGLYMLGEVSEATGAIFVVAHHLGKASLSRDNAKADPRTAARGSTAIFAAAGYAYLLAGELKAPKHVMQIKGRGLGDPLVEDFYLQLEPVRVDGFRNPNNPADGGGFRVAYRTKEQVNPPGEASSEIEADVRRIVAAVERHAGVDGVAGADVLAGLAGMKAPRARAALRLAMSRGRIRNGAEKKNGEPNEKHPRFFPAHDSSIRPPLKGGDEWDESRIRPGTSGTSGTNGTNPAAGAA